jgi:pimeloyl-ACP methyl ester carboxylesterase
MIRTSPRDAAARSCSDGSVVPKQSSRAGAHPDRVERLVLTNGHFLELAGVGHFPEVEAPAEFRAAVTAFLADRPVAGVA